MTISQEQIAANIAATQARRQAARDRDLAKREAERIERARHPYDAYNGKLVGFVVHTRKGFKPFIGRPIPDTYDSFISNVDPAFRTQAPQETLDQAVALLSAERDNLALILAKPVPGSSVSLGYVHWLSEMLAAQDAG